MVACQVVPGVPAFSSRSDSVTTLPRCTHGLFLPLLLSMANNVGLEAMRWGTGVTLTRIGADSTLVASLGQAARQRSERYSWKKMGALQGEVCPKVIRNR